MAAKWVFPPTAPYSVQGRDLSEDNFAQEDRTSLDILIREALQNPLDARAPDGKGAVRVRITVLQPGAYDETYLLTLLPQDYCDRLEASGGTALDQLQRRQIMVIEDFGTTGLQGTYSDPDRDGPGENWNAFWFREGEGAKSTPGSNGRAGQGKITYYRVGAARAVFGLTVRHSDGEALLMGRSAFRRAYSYQGKKFMRHAFWCSAEGKPLPLLDESEIRRFSQAFRLERAGQPGLSLVIPCPVDFVPKDAVRTIVAEFYYPIARGRLEVAIGGMEITADRIDTIADTVLPDDQVRARRSGFTSAYRKLVRETIADETAGNQPVQLSRGWEKTPNISEASLPEGALMALRASIENGKRVGVRFPVVIRPRVGQEVIAEFDVQLIVPEGLNQVEEAYIRRDLLIGSERHLGAAHHLQKAMALTLIQDSDLSAFLADAEEPTHLKWNGSRPRLAEDYANPQAALRAVRNAAPRLLALLLNGIDSKDTKALARYFTKPQPEGRRTGGGKKDGEKGVTPPGNDPPESERKPFRIVADADRVIVLPNGAAAPKPEDLPISCALEIAYEGLDQDCFKAYDPFDFDLSDRRAHAITFKGADVADHRGNRVRFRVTDTDFELKVPGFDPNIRLRARLNYTGQEDGAAVSEK